MVALEEIRKSYSHDFHKFDRGILREYLQYLILSIIYSHKIGLKLSFLGGTCLRIVYNSKRFSEDLDFDNKDLTEQEFINLSKYIQTELEKFGLLVEIKIVKKMAFHCKIRFSNLLKSNGLTGLEAEKILVQVDTFDQLVKYKTETHILNKFDITKPIIVTPKAVILSQKLWTITNRDRAKGRDFYDIVYLLQNTNPDKEFLFSKFNTSDIESVKSQITKYINKLNFEQLAQDVKPFLLNEQDLDKVKYFKEIFEQTSLS